ncbi:MFS transporter [Variovorax sp. J22P271]|uniref:MFS transporter n=1 Tax=Variovorax davisae TaxID=3053515 RepID=UPI0025786D07|nr:MFS transporter [Variovorax sp. J22P271]MDM0032874.1 MFS transporter [Variovorax sp. J22P271]
MSPTTPTTEPFKGLMFLLATTQLLLIVDASIVNVIVPTIAGELRFSETGQSWIANAYLTVFGGALLVSGRMADLLGRTRVFQAGLVVLVVGSAVSALARSPEVLIAGRAIQGLGSAFSAAASLALILAAFEGEQRYKALGLMAAMGGLGGALGTFLGGALTAWIGWRSTFWISVLIPASLLLYSFSVFARFDKGVHQGRADGLGGLLLIGGQTLLAWGIVQFGETSSDARALWVAVIAGLALLGGFLLRQQAIAHSLIPPATWRNSGLMEALLYAGIGQIVIFPMFFIGNLYLQAILHFSPLASGSAFLPLCAIVILTATNAGRWLRYGARESLTAGFALVTVGMAWLSLAGMNSVYWVDILGPTLLVGVGLPVIAITTNILGAQNARIGEEGLTSGLLNTFQQFGAVIGLAAMISTANFYAAHLAGTGQIPTAAELMNGYKMAFLLGGVVAAVATVGLLISLILRRGGTGREPTTMSRRD